MNDRTKKRISLNLSFEINGFDRGDPVKKAKRRLWAAVISLMTAAVLTLGLYVDNIRTFIGTPPPTQPETIEQVYP